MIEIPGVDFLLGIDENDNIYFLSNEALFDPANKYLNPKIARLQSQSFVGRINLNDLESDEYRDSRTR